MNVLDGELKSGLFTAEGVAVQTNVRADAPKAVLGLRPEDCRIATKGAGVVKGEIYATELIGDHTLVTLRVGPAMVTVKAPKDFSGTVGAPLGIEADPGAAFLFDARTGARLR